MFTGLVQATGKLRELRPGASGQRALVENPFGELELGESIAVNGACLTVVAFDRQRFAADISTETLSRTNLGELGPGALLNLERSLRVGDRLGGHYVTGHVDGLATVEQISSVGDARLVRLGIDASLAPFIAEKGSVTLDGVSLTVNKAEATRFEVMLIPHTLSVTNLGRLTVGTRQNCEVDLISRYVARQLSERMGLQGGSNDARLLDALKRSGFLG